MVKGCLWRVEGIFATWQEVGCRGIVMGMSRCWHRLRHTLSTHPLNTPYQHIISIYPINTPYQHTRSTHPLNTPAQHTLSPHPLNTPSHHTLSTHPLNTPYHHTLFTHPLTTPSHHTPPTHVGPLITLHVTLLLNNHYSSIHRSLRFYY